MEKCTMFMDWKNTPCSWTAKIIVKRTTPAKSIYRFNVVPTKLPAAFFKELDGKIFFFFFENLKICIDTHKNLNSQSTPKRKKKL